MTFLSIIRQKAYLNECSAVTWCTACISSMRKHAFYVGEMLWLCMVIFNQVQFDSLFKCNQCWLEILKRGFEKVKRRNSTTILSAHTMSHGWRLKHDFCCLFTWRCHKQDKEKQREMEGGERSAEGMSRFVHELTQWLCDSRLGNKTFWVIL